MSVKQPCHLGLLHHHQHPHIPGPWGMEVMKMRNEVTANACEMKIWMIVMIHESIWLNQCWIVKIWFTVYHPGVLCMRGVNDKRVELKVIKSDRWSNHLIVLGHIFVFLHDFNISCLCYLIRLSESHSLRSTKRFALQENWWTKDKNYWTYYFIQIIWKNMTLVYSHFNRRSIKEYFHIGDNQYTVEFN